MSLVDPKKSVMLDMYEHEEDCRIQMICEEAKRRGYVLFLVDKGKGYEGKGDRYIKKAQKINPKLEVLAREDGPVPGVETIKLGAKRQ